MSNLSKVCILDFLHFLIPTIEQKNTLLAIESFVNIENSEDFFILKGAAGTRKTPITSALAGYLNNEVLLD
jgi:exodeoxyribonuclease-5